MVPAKRARLVDSLKSPKRRSKLISRLYHFRDLDPRFLVEIPDTDQHPAAIADLLAERGAPPQCHLISTDPELDGQGLPLREVLDRIVGSGGAALVSCVPGRLGYFEGESMKDRCILARPR